MFFKQPYFDNWQQEEEWELLLSYMREEPYENESCRSAFRNLLIFDDEPINNLQRQIIV
jgi:hypothetical protein